MRSNTNCYIFLAIFFAVFAGLFWPAGDVSAEGAPQLYFKTTAESFAPDSELTVGAFIDSDKPVNAFHIEIGYSPQTLEFLNFNTNFSIVEFWREEPEVFSDGIIKIEGGTAKAFSGRAGEIIKLNFRAKQEGFAQWSFRGAQVYYADGQGTLAQSKVSPMSLKISSTAFGSAPPAGDEKTPILFDVQVAKDPTDDSRLAVFRAIDKESGLKAVYLRFRKWLSWEEWQKATNPVRLSAGVWSFQIKAVDNQGNISKQTVYIKDEALKKLIYLVLILAVIAGVYYFVKPQRKRKML